MSSPDTPRAGMNGGGIQEMAAKETRRASKRITKAEKIRRIDLIFDLLSKGFPRSKILQYISQQEADGNLAWGVSERMIGNYIKDASARFAELAEVRQTERFGRALVRLDDLYARCLDAHDYKTALAVVKTEVDLIGLAPPKRIEADVNLTTPEGLLALFKAGGEGLEKAWAKEGHRPAPDGEDLDEDPDEDEDLEEA